jgi:hypothetical protein
MHTRTISILTAAVLALALTGAAEAKSQTLYTAPANSVFGDSDTLFCQAVNVSNKTIDVTFESHDVNGNLVSTITHTLNPGEVRGLQEGSTAQYCKFLVPKRKSVRAQAIYYNTPGTHYLLAVPAQ